MILILLNIGAGVLEPTNKGLQEQVNFREFCDMVVEQPY